MTYVAPRIAPDVMGVKELGVNVIFRGKPIFRDVGWRPLLQLCAL